MARQRGGLLARGEARQHRQEARPHPHLDRQRFPEHAQPLMEPVVFPRADIHIHRVEELIARIPAFPLHGVNQRGAVLQVLLAGQAERLHQIRHGLKLHHHEAVEEDVRRGILRAAEAGGVVVHADHDVVMPDVQAAALAKVGAVVCKVALQRRDKIARPFPVAPAAGNQGDLAGEEGLMHVHAHALLVLHDQIGLRPLRDLDHHGNVAVGLLMVDEVAHVALGVEENLPVQLLGEQLRYAEQAVHRPEGIPVPHVAVIDGARVDERVMDEAAGLLEQRPYMLLNVLLQ